MEVTVERRYPVDVETLYAILTSKAFFEQRYAWGRVDNFRFDAFEETAEGVLIRIIQPIAIRTDKLPGFARRFLPSEADLATEFRWHPADGGGYQADYRFVLGSVPVKVSGTMTLLPGDAEAPGESRQVTHVAVRSSVPLVGGKLEKLIGQRFDKALEGDYRATLRYIKEAVDS